MSCCKPATSGDSEGPETSFSLSLSDFVSESTDTRLFEMILILNTQTQPKVSHQDASQIKMKPSFLSFISKHEKEE